MADYYPLLAKALAGLPSTTTPAMRQAIYDRAHKALIGQLRSLKPPLAEDVILREEAALEAAVARLEGERGGPSTENVQPSASQTSPAATSKPAAAPLAAAARPAAAPPLASTKPSPAGPAAAPALATRGAPPSAPTPARPAGAPNPAAVAAAPVRPPPAAGAPRYAPPPRPPNPSSSTAQQANPVRPPLASSSGSSTAATGPARLEPPPLGMTGAARHSASPPPMPVQALASGEDDGVAPLIAAESLENPAAPPIRVTNDSGRPAAPSLSQPRSRSPWPWVALALLVIAVTAAAGFALLWKEKPQDLAIKDTVETPAKNVSGQNKIVERVSGGDAGSNSAAPSAPASPAPPPDASANPAPSRALTASGAAETPIPTVTVPTVSVRPNDTAQGSSPAAPQPPAVSAPTQARAALLIETPSDPQKPKVDIGTATWTLIPVASGQAQAAGPAIQAEIDIPDMKMHATMTIRKNVDASLPATHTIDLRFVFADGADAKGFKDMALPQMRRDDTPTGDAVSGVRVKINDAYYLVGLTRSDADTTRNLDLLSSRNWLDFPLLFNDDHIAKLTFEKGSTGQSVVAQAIEAWK